AAEAPGRARRDRPAGEGPGRRAVRARLVHPQDERQPRPPAQALAVTVPLSSFAPVPGDASMLLRNSIQKRKGQALLEYALLIAAVALVALTAVSILGHKTTDMIAAVASVIPGAHTDDNNAIASGHLIETTVGANGAIEIDV